MPKLKSAVNSFLLTKKRLKRKTHKKRKTNRRYKRWMRGGALTDVQFERFLSNSKVVNNNSPRLGIIKEIMIGEDFSDQDAFDTRFQQLLTINDDEFNELQSKLPSGTNTSLSPKPIDNRPVTLQILDANGKTISEFLRVK